MTDELSTEELIRAALAIPAQLADMRHIYHGNPPETKAQQKLARWWERSELNFLKHFNSLEIAYRGSLKGVRHHLSKMVAPKQSAEADLAPDEGTQDTLTTVKKWLYHAAAEGNNGN